MTTIDPESVTALLVWKKDAKARGGFRSLWVERDGDKPKTIAERPGILFWSSSSLFTLEFTTIKGCRQLAYQPNGDVFTINGVAQYTRPDLQMPELVRISDGARVAPWKDGHGYPFMGTQCPDIETYGVNVEFEGGMGPVVVAYLRTYEDYGGAHGVRGENLFDIDLDKLSKVDIEPLPEDRPGHLAKAAKVLNGKPEEIQRNGTLFIYAPNGSALVTYKYFGSTSYAGSEGSSYSSSFVVDSKKLPPGLQGFSQLPAWALPVLAPRPVPVFMIPPSRLELFKKQFDAAYPAEKK